VLKTDDPEETSESPHTPFSWNWSYTEPKPEDVVIPYREGVTPPAKVSSTKLESYRTGKNEKNYQKFKKELDKFIENNP
jgi:hypothetical protein